MSDFDVTYMHSHFCNTLYGTHRDQFKRLFKCLVALNGKKHSTVTCFHE